MKLTNGKILKLVLDNIIFFLQRSGGVSVYWIENIKRLDKKEISIEYVEPKGISQNIFYREIRDKLNGQIKKEGWSARLLSFVSFRAKRKSKFIFHSSYYRIATSSKAINVVTVLDFMPEMYFSGLKRAFHSFRKKRAILKADGIVCISHHTRKDLLRYYPQISNRPIATIHLGISEDYKPLDRSVEVAVNLPPRSIVFVGRRSHYKNFSFAVDLIAEVDQYHLIVVGEDFSAEERKQISKLKDKCTLIKNPNSKKLNEIYNEAFCLLYPSFYEGFGIPVVEAMAAGCPVVALNTSSIPEISNGAALLQDHLSIEEFAVAIRSLENKSLRDKLRLKGLKNAENFKWENAVNQLVDFYNLMYNKVDK